MNKVTFILLASISAFPVSHATAQEQPPMQQQPMDAPPASGNGMLRVRLDDGSPISVSLDGRYLRTVNPVLTVGDIPDGQHYLRIYVHRYGWGDRRGMRQLIFEGNVNVFQGQMTVFSLNPFTGSTRMNTRDARPRAYYRPDYEDYAYGIPENDQNGSQNNGYNDQYNQPGNGNPPGNYNAAPNGYNGNPVNTPPASPDNNSNDNNNYQDNNNSNSQDYSNNNSNNNQGGYYNGETYHNDNSVPPAISQADQPTSVDQPFMDRLKKKVDAKITDTNKLKALKDGLAEQTVSTAQVNAMMGWLNFEASRVDLAKWAYDKTVDKQNYPQLEGQFSFHSSKNELDDYINSKR